MRFRRLLLSRFGHFQDQEVDFGPKPEKEPDFHVLYGLNEAGKTTLLFAILRLLYGFKRKDPYDFRHRGELQVGAEIEGLPGRGPVRVWRVKRNNALIDETGRRLEDDLFATALGGLSEDDYRRIFSLDRESVIQGSKDISEGRGEAARTFFAAHAGLSNLTATLDDLDRAASELFKPAGRKDEARRLLAEIKRLNAEVKQRDTTAGAYDGLKRAAKKAREEKEAQVSAVQSLQQQVRALDRLISLRDSGLKLRDLKAELAARYASYPDWPADPHSASLAALNGEAESARAALEARTEKITEIEISIQQADPDDAVVALDQPIEELETLRAGATGAITHLLQRRAEAEEIAERMTRRLNGLLVAPRGALREEFVLEREPMATLTEAARALSGAEEGAERVKKDLEEARSDLGKVREERAEDLEASLLDAATAEQITLLDPIGACEAAEEARIAIRLKRSEFEDALAEIQTPGHGFDTAPDTDHAPDGVREQEAERTRQAEAAKVALARAAVLDREIESDRAEIARRESAVGQDVADGSASRDRRDAAWDTHRAALDGNTADAFEAEMRRHDLVEEQRFCHAHELGAVAEARAALKSRAEEREESHVSAEAAGKSIAALDQAHRDAVAALGLPTGFSRNELAEWLKMARKVSQRERRMRDEEKGREADLEREAAVARKLRSLMPDLENLEDPRVLAVASERLEAHGAAEATRERARKQLERVKKKVGDCESTLKLAEQAVADARSAWHAAELRCLPADHGLRDPLEAVDALSEIAQDGIEWRSLLKRVRGMRRDVGGYITTVARVLRALESEEGAPEGVSVAAEVGRQEPDEAEDRRLVEAVGEAMLRERALQDRLRQARTTRERLEKDKAELEGLEKRRDLESEKLKQAAAAIALYRKRFPETIDTSTFANLERAVVEARKATAKREEAASLEEKLKATLAETESDDPVAFAEVLAEQGLEGQRRQVEADLDDMRAKRETAIAALGAAERDLEDVGGDGAATANAERAAQEQLLVETVLTATIKRMGLYLARRAIDAFRQENRSETMRAAGAAFAGLTRGRYANLTSRSEDGLEKLVAHCVDDDVVRTAADMSAGTRMQLYYALRLAAYRDHVRRGVNCPFLADDVFESFDDHRTQAACEQMREIGLVGQSIYLTHHSEVGRRAIIVSDGRNVVRLMPGVDEEELERFRSSA